MPQESRKIAPTFLVQVVSKAANTVSMQLKAAHTLHTAHPTNKQIQQLPHDGAYPMGITHQGCSPPTPRPAENRAAPPREKQALPRPA